MRIPTDSDKRAQRHVRTLGVCGAFVDKPENEWLNVCILPKGHEPTADCKENEMIHPIGGYGLYDALKAEGYELPDECGDVEIRMPVDGAIQLALIVNLTNGPDGSLVKFGKALVRMAEINGGTAVLDLLDGRNGS